MCIRDRPSAVGYQPTLATEVGELQERIASTQNGSVTSVQAVYVPADDLTDPAPATTFAHLDATTVLSRKTVSYTHLDVYKRQIMTYDLYNVNPPSGLTSVPDIEAHASDDNVKITISKPSSLTGIAYVRFELNGKTKTYRIPFAKQEYTIFEEMNLGIASVDVYKRQRQVRSLPLQ